MHLVERHLVKADDSRFAIIDAAAFASKNLYNQALYQIRQAYIQQGAYVPYAEVFHLVKGMDCYKALPAKVANCILILLHKNWVAFFEALEAYHADPSRFAGRPKLPKHKDKVKGRNILIYDKQALGKRVFKKTGKLLPSGLPIWTVMSCQRTRPIREEPSRFLAHALREVGIERVMEPSFMPISMAAITFCGKVPPTFCNWGEE